MDTLIAPVDVRFAVEDVLDTQSAPYQLPFEGMDKSGEEVCKAYLAGQCPRGRYCPYRHTSGQKEVVCKHWLRGLCKKGDNCEFLHQYDPLRMPECYFYVHFGECNNDECPFQHIDPESKIRDCAWYARGFCKHGPDCKHRHRKAVICEKYLSGFCPDGPDCPLAHPSFDLPASTTIDPETGKPEQPTKHTDSMDTSRQAPKRDMQRQQQQQVPMQQSQQHPQQHQQQQSQQQQHHPMPPRPPPPGMGPMPPPQSGMGQFPPRPPPMGGMPPGHMPPPHMGQMPRPPFMGGVNPAMQAQALARMYATGGPMHRPPTSSQNQWRGQPPPASR